MKEFKEDFKEQFYKLCKSHGLKPGDKKVKEVVRALNEDLLTIETEPRYFGKDYSLEDTDYKDFAEFQGKIVQGCIDFINSHPKIQGIIENKKKELTEEWNKDYTGKYPIIPDTRVYFGVDGLEESLKIGNWTPYTDSFLNLCIGNISILGVM